MSQDKIDILQRALAREKAARKQAEKILEDKAAELYEAKVQLEKSYIELEHLLNKTDSQLQGVFENIVDAYVIIDLFGNILKMNEPAVSLLGFKTVKDDFNLMNLVHPNELNRVSKAFKSLFNKGSITDFHLKIITKNNQHKIVHINASVIYDNGVPVAAQGIVRDITQKKADEEQLIESENRLSTLILNLESGVLLEDENRNIVLTNKKFCEFMQIPASPEELKGYNYSKIIENSKHLFKNPNNFIERINTLIKNKKLVLGDELIMADGTILERDFIPITHNQEYKGHLWKYSDVTLRRRYRKSLEMQKEKYHNIISNMNLGLVEVDANDRISTVNQSFVEMTGYSEKELIGSKGKDYLPIEEDKPLMIKKVAERKKGKTDTYEIRIKKKKGDIGYWLISGMPNYNLEGELIGSIGVNFDITEIKNLHLQKENLLKKLEKSNDELHEYAHVVSHDLKSPLRSINALVSWLKDDNKEILDESSLQNIALIESTLEKMEQLITDVLEYSSVGSEDTEMHQVDLDIVINDLLKILYIPEHISVKVLNHLPKIQGNKTKLQQLFQNLISNAIKFSDKEKGLIEINCTELETHFQFSVKDNGIGIEEQFHDKIFKIFHALNKSKDSTGIGLSIVKKIVELHQGDIWLKSQPGKGTTFFFTLKK
ncbi:PAS domain S-box protein [Seonamhaeicola sp.]|uniref:PAS domain-containing sensor histidine kinase n=1 Tax=Seonamhaeicola sp. TaxID=1912245 RepID=UPI003564BEFB